MFFIAVDRCAHPFVLACLCPGCSMKRASSLNVLNAGGKATEDHFQVRSLPRWCSGRQVLSSPATGPHWSSAEAET
jgi:hypothetical protein